MINSFTHGAVSVGILTTFKQFCIYTKQQLSIKQIDDSQEIDIKLISKKLHSNVAKEVDKSFFILIKKLFD